ncbi:DNA helicase MCM9-like [Sitophilus oryzae]|uniref:DNA helicase MCM9 n=1 Tax=Sitophilus oryzae TaxID=7048 RepID=A0A6J2XVC5_SITOR|nr:DNA helicase MCM9-like [Sitophilus oryzae]
MCEKYLVSNHKLDILGILEDSDIDKCYTVNINFLELFESDTNLGNALLSDPEKSLRNWNDAIMNVQDNFLKEYDKKFKLKSKVTCRIHTLPPWPHISRVMFPGNDDAEKFLQITGTVVRLSERKLLEYQRQYMCIKCKYPITVVALYDKKNIIKIPKRCINPEGCTCKNIVSFGELDSFNCKDYQEIKIQEDVSKINIGTVPKTITVTLEDDLVNICKPGENITITGIVKRRWSEFEKGVKMLVDIVMRANHVQINNSGVSMTIADDTKVFFNKFWQQYKCNPLDGRNIILNSISPEIYGLHLIKLAIAIVLAGGSQTDEEKQSTGIDTRSESHLLLVGDPGTGKSQMLKFASKIVRSVLTTGIGSTGAGLTVSAVMENGEWHLEAGALVMADGGICCIDEFNSMREHDRTSIHEAMEQQTISVAKAGMVCKLKTRCSVLAACNPKGNIDIHQPLCMNVAMSGPLLSRFDLIILLRDIVEEENDLKFAHLLLSHITASNNVNYWDLEKLQVYYILIRKLNPMLSAEAETILSTYYHFQRKFGSRNKARTTVRLLESLIRLSQGHAKLMFHSEVEVMDTIFPIILVDNSLDYESSLFNFKIDNNAFFENPEEHYTSYLNIILEKLNLDHILVNQNRNNDEDIAKFNKSSPEASTSSGKNVESPNQFNMETPDKGTSNPELVKHGFPNMFDFLDTGKRGNNSKRTNLKKLKRKDEKILSQKCPSIQELDDIMLNSDRPLKHFGSDNINSKETKCSENNLECETRDVNNSSELQCGSNDSNLILEDKQRCDNTVLVAPKCTSKKSRKEKKNTNCDNLLSVLPSVNDDFSMFNIDFNCDSNDDIYDSNDTRTVIDKNVDDENGAKYLSSEGPGISGVAQPLKIVDEQNANPSSKNLDGKNSFNEKFHNKKILNEGLLSQKCPSIQELDDIMMDTNEPLKHFNSNEINWQKFKKSKKICIRKDDNITSRTINVEKSVEGDSDDVQQTSSISKSYQEESVKVDNSKHDYELSTSICDISKINSINNINKNEQKNCASLEENSCSINKSNNLQVSSVTNSTLNVLSKFQFVPKELREKDNATINNINQDNKNNSTKESATSKTMTDINNTNEGQTKSNKKKFNFKRLSTIMDFDKLDNDIKGFEVANIVSSQKTKSYGIKNSQNEDPQNIPKDSIEGISSKMQINAAKRNTKIHSNFPMLNLDLNDMDL